MINPKKVTESLPQYGAISYHNEPKGYADGSLVTAETGMAPVSNGLTDILLNATPQEEQPEDLTAAINAIINPNQLTNEIPVIAQPRYTQQPDQPLSITSAGGAGGAALGNIGFDTFGTDTTTGGTTADTTGTTGGLTGGTTGGTTGGVTSPVVNKPTGPSTLFKESVSKYEPFTFTGTAPTDLTQYIPVFDPRTGYRFESPAEAMLYGVNDYVYSTPTGLAKPASLANFTDAEIAAAAARSGVSVDAYMNAYRNKEIGDARSAKFEDYIKTQSGGLSPQELIARLEAYKQNPPKTYQEYVEQQALYSDYKNRYAGGTQNMAGISQNYDLAPAERFFAPVSAYADPIDNLLNTYQSNYNTMMNYNQIKDLITKNPVVADAYNTAYGILQGNEAVLPTTASQVQSDLQRLNSDISKYGEQEALYRYYNKLATLYRGTTPTANVDPYGDPTYRNLRALAEKNTPVVDNSNWYKNVNTQLTDNNKQIVWRDPVTGKGIGFGINPNSQSLTPYNTQGGGGGALVPRPQDIVQLLDEYGMAPDAIGRFNDFLTANGYAGVLNRNGLDVSKLNDQIKEMASDKWVQDQLAYYEWQRQVASQGGFTNEDPTTRINEILRTNAAAKRVLSGQNVLKAKDGGVVHMKRGGHVTKEELEKEFRLADMIDLKGMGSAKKFDKGGGAYKTDSLSMGDVGNILRETTPSVLFEPDPNSVIDSLLAEHDISKAFDLIGKNVKDFYTRAQTPEGAMDIGLGLGMTPIKGIQKVASKVTKATPNKLEDEFRTQNLEKLGVPEQNISKEVADEAASNVSPNLWSLKESFDDALSNYYNLPLEERIAISRDAQANVGKYVGVDKKGKPKDIMSSNMKLMKTEKGFKGGEPIQLEDGRGVETIGLSLSPAYQEGKFNTCPNSMSCKTACLGKTAGGNFQFGGGSDLEAMKGPRLVSYNKTQAMLRDPKSFIIRMNDEIEAAKKVAEKNGNHLSVRLNVLSDINPKAYEQLIKQHPDVTFYDYTKLDADPIAPNHHLTYSSTGISQPAGYNGIKEDVINPHQNWGRMRRRLDNGDNITMVFSHKEILPSSVVDEETGKLYKVVDGDTHDFRPFDKTPDGYDGVVVGLRNKAMTTSQENAAKKTNGFVVNFDPQIEKVKGKIVRDENGRPIVNNDKVVIPVQPKRSINIQKKAKGGLVTDDKAGLDIDNYLQQYHHFDKFNDDHDGRPEWYEQMGYAGGGEVKGYKAGGDLEEEFKNTSRLIPKSVINALNTKRKLSPAEAKIAGQYAKPENQWDLGSILQEVDPAYTIGRGAETLKNVDYGAIKDLLLQRYQLEKDPRAALEKELSQMGEAMFGALDVAPAGAIATKPARKAIKSLAPEVARAIEKATVDPYKMYAIKPEGGQWMTNRLDKELEGIAMPDTDAELNKAINGWIRGPLRKYLMNRMGTESDELLKLYDAGIYHKDPYHIQGYPIDADAEDLPKYMDKIRSHWYPSGKTNAKTPEGFRWEMTSELALRPRTAREVKDSLLLREQAPWVEKLDPNEIVYGLGSSGYDGDTLRNLGFEHIIDVLKSDIREGKLRPEQLNKVSIEDAAKRTHQYNVEMAKKAEEAGIKIQQGIPIHREYPEGYKWVELKHPDDAQKTEEALRYEGDTMGHCVGSYCEDVMSGDTRIFSLRDSNGRPHVTIEVTGKDAPSFYQANEHLFESNPELKNFVEYVNDTSGSESEFIDDVTRKMKQLGIKPVSPEGSYYIKQIKGKGNAKPADKYIPYVQDFVKNPVVDNDWAGVGDFRNTNLIDVRKMREHGVLPDMDTEGTNQILQEIDRLYPTAKTPTGGLVFENEYGRLIPNTDMLKYEVQDLPSPYLTKEDILEHLRNREPRSIEQSYSKYYETPPKEGMANGGLVYAIPFPRDN